MLLWGEMRGDPQAEETAVFAPLRASVGPSPLCATSADVTDRNHVKATSASTSIRANLVRKSDRDCISSLVLLVVVVCL